MPNNKKKNKQKKKSNGSTAASASSDSDTNLNAQVLEALTRLADTLAQLDETCDNDDAPENTVDSAADEAVDLLAEETAAMMLDDGEAAETTALANDAADGGTDVTTSSTAPTTDATPPPKPTLTPPALPLSHWRTLPLQVTSAYKILNDGAEYIHATSTKYTLVGKIDIKEGGNLAVELRKGAELIGTATLLLFSPSCGSSRSLRHYVKQSSRSVLASVISLVKSFEDGVSQGKANDGNNIGAQKTGVVWSACDKLTGSLPKGNRAAMRRELMVWVRDCNESIEEFEEVLSLGPLDDDDDDDGDDAMMDEDQYRGKEMKVAKASMNVMKCSKNLLGLVLKACECVGEHADKLSQGGNEVAEAGGEESTTILEHPDDSAEKQQMDDKRREMLRWISNLHEMARTVGEGVTNVGILLYPPLDFANDQEELEKWQAKKPKTTAIDEFTIPSLGSTTLGLQLEHQLYALSECIESVHGTSLPVLGESFQSCLSEEVVNAAVRLRKAIPVRCREVEEA
eukprot:CAMPEP_0201933136 /NCGR_PEP_ID=MMETSP0903-20130614/30904_1 /ASSEMBLY_ACC=CAM_ASM_000552 /TAXON_ID=420261 /ORGANISM="Thalassiosira antarctica, Strain CCMP982" /LENGTH=513 /DNA_ID=CAMNT_0048472961 /DNA_START=54 /DNA_END=1591 /DNA_ORIENTATION=+